MLKREAKEVLILWVFSFLLFDFLKLTTLLAVIAGSIIVLKKIKLSKIIKNIITLGIFSSYWVVYRKVIDPEVGLNFLVSIIVLKLIEKEGKRDQYMIFFGLFLLISAGALFDKTLSYVIFFCASFSVLIYDFYSGLNIKWSFTRFIKTILIIAPLASILFFIAPRALNPIPFYDSRPGPGEIGYTPNVTISQVGELISNDRPVFQAVLSKEIPQNRLYWRGNTLSMSDGWDWMVSGNEYSQHEALNKKDRIILTNEVEQKIKLYGNDDYLFMLDIPLKVIFNESSINLKDNRTLSQSKWKWNSKYTVISQPDLDFQDTSENFRRYKTISLKKDEIEWVKKNIYGNNLTEVVTKYKSYIFKNNFSYTLSPGRVMNFNEFMVKKKTGFCSHYASALAHVLRVNKIPTRLVSGFMGGDFNTYAEFYLILQNDAHVWVEAFENGRWLRLDPTEWILPQRVTLGGNAFVQEVTQRGVIREFIKKNMRWLNSFGQWFAQWDFRFYQWLDQIDYFAQDSWLLRLNLKRKSLYYLSFFIIALFSLLYFLLINFSKATTQNPTQKIWKLFIERMAKKGIILNTCSLKMAKEQIDKLQSPQKTEILQIWDELVKWSFTTEDKMSYKELKARINQI